MRSSHERNDMRIMKRVRVLVIEGRNAVLEALRSGQDRWISCMYRMDARTVRCRTIVREAKKHDAIRAVCE